MQSQRHLLFFITRSVSRIHDAQSQTHKTADKIDTRSWKRTPNEPSNFRGVYHTRGHGAFPPRWPDGSPDFWL